MELFPLILAGYILNQTPPPHKHEGHIPDWYDQACCNRRDCHPVSDDDIEALRLGEEPAFRYRPANLLFTKDKFKTSKDERYHVCINDGVPLCFYIPAGT